MVRRLSTVSRVWIEAKKPRQQGAGVAAEPSEYARDLCPAIVVEAQRIENRQCFKNRLEPAQKVRNKDGSEEKVPMALCCFSDTPQLQSRRRMMQVCSTFVLRKHEGCPLQASSVKDILAVCRAGRRFGRRSGWTAQRQTEETEDHESVETQDGRLPLGVGNMKQPWRV